MNFSGFVLTLAAASFSIFLMGWQLSQGPNADWVSGFLAVFWSLLMMLRLMTLTASQGPVSGSGGLAQKIIVMLRSRDEKHRQAILETSLGGSFVLFVSAVFLFAVWQIFCAAFPLNAAFLMDLKWQAAWMSDTPLWTAGKVFDWGQSFLLLLSFCMMGFVLRSHASQVAHVRPVLIIIAGYAISGLIAFAGLDTPKNAVELGQTGLIGNGAGALTWLAGPLDEKALSLFEVLLLENGVGGLGMLTFLLFVPMGYVALAAHRPGADRFVTFCGVSIGAVVILSAFLPLTPALAGFLALCWTGLCLAWGASEHRLTKEQK